MPTEFLGLGQREYPVSTNPRRRFSLVEQRLLSYTGRGLTLSDVFTHHRELTSCHMCNIAMLLKHKLRWDPKKEEFIGDGEANV